VKVKDVMTKDPITIGPETPLRDVAAILVENGISGLPVVGVEGEVLGVVSEGDLLPKAAVGGEVKKRSSAWLLFKRADEADEEKRAARTAAAAMSSPGITVRPEQQVAEAARAMVENGVNRLPVVDESGRVVGIVTRADLVRTYTRRDDEIRREIEDDVVVGMLWMAPNRVTVQVRRGEVTLDGRMDTEIDAELLPRLVERVPGVITVTSNLSWSGEEESHRRSRKRPSASATRG
jgi:CBS domain-containing protein